MIDCQETEVLTRGDCDGPVNQYKSRAYVLGYRPGETLGLCGSHGQQRAREEQVELDSVQPATVVTARVPQLYMVEFRTPGKQPELIRAHDCYTDDHGHLVFVDYEHPQDEANPTLVRLVSRDVFAQVRPVMED